MNKTARRYLLLVLALMPALAMAQAVAIPELSNYAAKSGDYALDMLASIFGSANGIFGGTQNERFNEMLLAFNVAVLSVAATWFGYSIVTGILGMAKSLENAIPRSGCRFALSLVRPA